MDDSCEPTELAAALEFLYGRINYERNATLPARSRGLGLDCMSDLLERLGNPHERLPVVHIAGTKGKGSTAAILAAVLSAAGYRTGLYTSPHLQRLEERFVVDHAPCTAGELIELVAQLRPVVAAMDREYGSCQPPLRGPTFFEITTAMAMLYFVQKSADLVVLEVGMGGRLDSTNVCRPLVSLITSISLDHTKQLGNTLAEIAREKAGIIKPGVPVVSGVTQDEAQRAVAAAAQRHGCRLTAVQRDFRYEYQPAAAAVPGQAPGAGTLTYWQPADDAAPLRVLPTRLLGRHQAANAAVALAALGQLAERGWPVPDFALARGLTEVYCPARIEVVAERPVVIVDSAHNVASVAALREVLRESFRARRRVLVFATTRDKDARGMLRLLWSEFDDVILTRYLDNPRAMQLDQLAGLAEQLAADTPAAVRAPRVTVCDSPAAAWQRCRALVGSDDLVCITGSFFLAAEMRPWLASLVPNVSRM